MVVTNIRCASNTIQMMFAVFNCFSSNTALMSSLVAFVFWGSIVGYRWCDTPKIEVRHFSCWRTFSSIFFFNSQGRKFFSYSYEGTPHPTPRNALFVRPSRSTASGVLDVCVWCVRYLRGSRGLSTRRTKSSRPKGSPTRS